MKFVNMNKILNPLKNFRLTSYENEMMYFELWIK